MTVTFGPLSRIVCESKLSRSCFSQERAQDRTACAGKQRDRLEGGTAMTAFQDIYQHYAEDVHRFALYLSGDRELAEDITSEAFVRLYTSDQSKIRMLTIKAYLFAIARHLYVDSRRSAARHVAMDADFPEHTTSPEMHAIYKSELREVLKQLQKMPEVDRTVLLLRAQQGMSYEEIARVVGISLAAVKVKMHRARLRLAETLNRGSDSRHSKGGLQ